MENFLYGIEAIARGTWATIVTLGNYELFWGFALGFLVSTFAHMFVITDKPSHIPLMLFSDKVDGFKKISHKDAKGTYTTSFEHFSRTVDRVQLLVGLGLLMLFVILLVALFNY